MKQPEALLFYLKYLYEDPSYAGVMKFHQDHEQLILTAKGSKSKHQAWPGGYLDHLVECIEIGGQMMDGLRLIRPLPFSFESVIKVLYFHDIEKMFKYSGVPMCDPKHPEVFSDKMKFYREIMPAEWGIEFTAEELNALENIHGEVNYGEHRVAGPLAAFCHCCDMLSARMWHDKPTKEEKDTL